MSLRLTPGLGFEELPNLESSHAAIVPVMATTQPRCLGGSPNCTCQGCTPLHPTVLPSPPQLNSCTLAFKLWLAGEPCNLHQPPTNQTTDPFTNAPPRSLTGWQAGQPRATREPYTLQQAEQLGDACARRPTPHVQHVEAANGRLLTQQRQEGQIRPGLRAWVQEVYVGTCINTCICTCMCTCIHV